MMADKEMATLQALKTCAAAWEPGVCLIGNVRASEIIEAVDALVIENDRLRRALEDALDNVHSTPCACADVHAYDTDTVCKDMRTRIRTLLIR